MDHAGISSQQGPSEETVSAVLAMMCRTHSGLNESDPMPEIVKAVFSGLEPGEVRKMDKWDVELFVSVALDTNKSLDWYKVLLCLDQKDFVVYDGAGLGIILNASKVALKALMKFPMSIFLQPWKNVRGQFSFLKQALQGAPELFSLSPNTRRVLNDSFVIPPSGKTLAGALVQQPWNSIDLIEAMLALAETDIYSDVKTFLEFSSQQSPELLLLGLSQLSTQWTTVQKELASNLVMMFLIGHPSSSFVLPILWQLNQQLPLAGLVHMYAKDQSTLSRILDIAQDMKALSQILEAKPYAFSIDLAALASRRDYLNLELWLQERIRADGNTFMRSCLDFLTDRVQSQRNRQDGAPQTVPLSADVIAIFLRNLLNRA
ncbi:CCR4-NOT transcription complex subunit 1, partial [Irineochytrium annulatum]